MNESVEAWMGEAAVNRLVLACGVRLADRSIAVRAFRDGLTEVGVEQALRKVADAVQLIQRFQVAAQRLRWSFENRDIHCMLFPGGAMAVLFVNVSGAGEEDIDALFDRFPVDS